MEQVQQTIEKAKKCCALAHQEQCYAITFNNQNPPSPQELHTAFQEVKNDPAFVNTPTLAALQHIFDTHSRVYDTPIFFRFLCMMEIFRQAGFVPFCYDSTFNNAPYHKYNQSYSLAIACTETASKQQLETVLAHINQVYTPYFNDTLTIHHAPQALDCLHDRLDLATREITEQTPWLFALQGKMLDDISRQSFSHFLCERLHFQIFMGVYSRYPISAPPCTLDWRHKRIASFFDVPKEWSLVEAETRILTNDPAVKAKKQFPALQGVPKAPQIFMFFHNFVLEQYAVSGKSLLKDGAIVIDAGAYIGDTAIYFAEKNPTTTIYAFEPIPSIANFAKENCAAHGITNVTIVQEALSDTAETVSFSSSNGWFTDTKLVETQETSSPKALYPNTPDPKECQAQSILLDIFMEQKDIVTTTKNIFIKMDVEGLEMRILRGARKTITQCTPTCAIALYHKHLDYIEIPQFLLELCPDYRFYFRCDAEPVLFATRKK